MSIKDAALRTAVLKAVADALKAETDADRGALQQALIDLYDATGGKTLDVRLPNGERVATISLPISQSAWRVTDRAKLKAWCEANRPEWLYEVPAHTEVAEAAVLEAVEQTGEDVPGVTFEEGGTPQSFRVTFEKSGRRAIAAAWSDGVFGHSLPGMAPALPEEVA